MTVRQATRAVLVKEISGGEVLSGLVEGVGPEPEGGFGVAVSPPVVSDRGVTVGSVPAASSWTSVSRLWTVYVWPVLATGTEGGRAALLVPPAPLELPPPRFRTLTAMAPPATTSTTAAAAWSTRVRRCLRWASRGTTVAEPGAASLVPAAERSADSLAS